MQGEAMTNRQGHAGQTIPHAGEWSPFRRAGCCPKCGAWVKVASRGRTMPVEGRRRCRYLYCGECGESFKAWEYDQTV